MMEGQWIGRYSGSNNGQIFIDLDDLGDNLEGHAFLFDDVGLPGSMVPLVFTRSPKNSIKVPIFALQPGHGAVISHDELAKLAPNIVFPTEADVKIERTPKLLKVSWKTNIGTFGSASIKQCQSDRRSTYHSRRDVKNWKSFKEFATGLEPDRFIFRGQDVTRRLRTAFHRTRRKDLIRFMQRDIPVAHRVLTARTRHLFNLGDPLQNAAFWNLIQHHGYPTPLLDWSHSPFVAAFFAYRYNRVSPDDDSKVRIFAFDRAAWTNDFPQIQSIAMVPPHFSILEALTIENTRALPQQALSSVTNLDDIESYIQAREVDRNKRYLEVIDLPRSERRMVMQELSLMGITAGSLFPGLDGACEELRGRFFHPVR